MKFNLLQYNIVWEDIESNLKFLTKQLENLPVDNSIILLPETFSTGFSMNADKLAQAMNGSAVQWMQLNAKKYNCIIAGSLLIKENKYFYNRFVWAFPDSTLRYYNKRHLFRMGGENKNFKSGQERVIIEWQGVKILPLICYDLRFPVWSRNLNDYDIIVYSANWPLSRINAWQTLLKARAIENQAYVLAVNRVGADGENVIYGGNSLALDFKGETIELGSQVGEQVISVSIDIQKQEEFKNTFPVWKDADDFIINL
jgi:omega-amidase